MNKDFPGYINNTRRWNDKWNEAILAAHTASAVVMFGLGRISRGRSSNPFLELVGLWLGRAT